MKKLFTLTLLLSSLLLAQLPNASFENWTAGEPDGWNTTNSTGLVVVSATTPAQQGNYALKGETVSFQGFIFPPMVLLGTDGDGIPNTTRYTRMSGYYKFTQAGGDNFTITIALTKTGDITVGGGAVTLPPATDYTLFNLDVTYATNDTPDTLLVSFSITGTGGSLGTLGTSFIIDNLSLSTATSNDEQTIGVNNFSLEQNYPNPFNPTTKIKFSVPTSPLTPLLKERGRGEVITLKVFDILGNEVATLVDEEKAPGVYEVEFSGSNLPSGIYFYQLRSGQFIETKKMILLR